MPKTYHPATDEMLDRFRAAFDDHFSILEDESIRFDIQAVTTDGEHALSKGALALIKVVGPEERSRGGPDVRILVDFKKYMTYTDLSREATFAHELYHIIVVKNKQGFTKRDPYDRPVIRLKPDDWYITGFKQVADWYGVDSIEQISHARMEHALFRQTLFQFQCGYDDNGTGALPFKAAAEDEGRKLRKAEIESELAAGVREVEAERAADPYAWRTISVLDLGLAHHTEGVLKRHDIATVGELVALGAHAADWIEDAEKIDIAEGLARFRQRRSNADIEEFDAACAEAAKKTPAAAAPRPKRVRKAKVSA